MFLIFAFHAKLNRLTLLRKLFSKLACFRFQSTKLVAELLFSCQFRPDVSLIDRLLFKVAEALQLALYVVELLRQVMSTLPAELMRLYFDFFG